MYTSPYQSFIKWFESVICSLLVDVLTTPRSLGGALAFVMNGLPSWYNWLFGSAKNSQYRASTLYTGLSKKEYVK